QIFVGLLAASVRLHRSSDHRNRKQHFSTAAARDLFRWIERSRQVIGIFGTQYRSSIDRNLMRPFLKSLDVWYARFREDLLMFGGDCKSVHLGNWLISAFPLARPGPNAAETSHLASPGRQGRRQRYRREAGRTGPPRRETVL